MGKYVDHAWANFEITIKGSPDLNKPWFKVDWSKAKSVIPYPLSTAGEEMGGKIDLVSVNGIPAVALTAVANRSFGAGGTLGTPITKATQANLYLLTRRWYSNQKDYKNQEGEEDWTRVKIFFPHDYTPSGLFNGEWGGLFGWHTDDYTQKQNGNSILFEVFASNWDSNFRGKPSRLVLRLMGGDLKKPIIDSRSCSQPDGSLRLEHWYEVVVHMVWSADPKVGKAEMWIDGLPICKVNFPTLYTREDKSISWTSGFTLYNYRPMHDWSSTVYFGNFEIGPTAQSIGFKET